MTVVSRIEIPSGFQDCNGNAIYHNYPKTGGITKKVRISLWALLCLYGQWVFHRSLKRAACLLSFPGPGKASKSELGLVKILSYCRRLFPFRVNFVKGQISISGVNLYGNIPRFSAAFNRDGNIRKSRNLDKVIREFSSPSTDLWQSTPILSFSKARSLSGCPGSMLDGGISPLAFTRGPLSSHKSSQHNRSEVINGSGSLFSSIPLSRWKIWTFIYNIYYFLSRYFSLCSTYSSAELKCCTDLKLRVFQV